MAHRVLPEGEEFAFGAGESGVFTLSGSSQQSAALKPGVYRIATAAQPAWVKTGANPTAAADGNSLLLGANAELRLRIAADEKIAVLQAGTAGTLAFARMK